jgi:DNA-binding winged helix-turn-helix (wHTH) protein
MSKTHSFGPFHLDVDVLVLFRDAEPLSLGQRAVALLRVLLERPGVPVSKDTLIEVVWSGRSVEQSNLTVQIAALRRVLAQAGGARWIETWPRRGYRFVGPAVTRRENGEVLEPKVPAAVAIMATRKPQLGSEAQVRHDGRGFERRQVSPPPSLRLDPECDSLDRSAGPSDNAPPHRCRSGTRARPAGRRRT